MKTIYLAYGMNTNPEEMAFRCPDSRYLGNVVLHGLRLEFCGVADVHDHAQSSCHVAAWEVSAADERALDVLEGFPHLYGKEYTTIEHPETGEEVRAMFYRINEGHARRQLGRPSTHYWALLNSGYAEHGLPGEQLQDALERAERAEKKPIGNSYRPPRTQVSDKDRALRAWAAGLNKY